MSSAEPQPIALNDSWLTHLQGEFEQAYMKALKSFLRSEKKQSKLIYPPGKDIFNAMNAINFEDVSVVILGQDPYHGAHQAHGFSFSVKPTVPIPPSLKNIFKEMNDDIGCKNGQHGCLTPWANQGVLLLNAVLTVEAKKAASHQGKGWETFTDAVIRTLSEAREQLVFMLWGSYAQRKGAVIDAQRHLVLKAAHPSPFSAHRGFLGCRHFSIANHYLSSKGKKTIDWQLPPVSAFDEEGLLVSDRPEEVLE